MPSSIYVCEKCGKIYQDWDGAYKCEHSHARAADLLMNDGEKLKKAGEYMYSEGSFIPSAVLIRFASEADGDEETQREVWEYKRVKCHPEIEKEIEEEEAEQARREEEQRLKDEQDKARCIDALIEKGYEDKTREQLEHTWYWDVFDTYRKFTGERFPR